MPDSPYFEDAPQPIVVDELADALKNVKMKPITPIGESKPIGESVGATLGRIAGMTGSYLANNLRQRLAYGIDRATTRLAGLNDELSPEWLLQRIPPNNDDFVAYRDKYNAYKAGEGEDPSKDYAGFTNSMTYELLDPDVEKVGPVGRFIGGLWTGRSSDPDSPVYVDKPLTDEQKEEGFRNLLATAKGVTGYLGDKLPEQIGSLLGELGFRGSLAAAGMAGGINNSRDPEAIKEVMKNSVVQEQRAAKAAKKVKGKAKLAKGGKGKAAPARYQYSREAVVGGELPDEALWTTRPEIVRGTLPDYEYIKWRALHKKSAPAAENYFREYLRALPPERQKVTLKEIIIDRLKTPLGKRLYLDYGEKLDNASKNVFADALRRELDTYFEVPTYHASDGSALHDYEGYQSLQEAYKRAIVEMMRKNDAIQAAAKKAAEAASKVPKKVKVPVTEAEKAAARAAEAAAKAAERAEKAYRTRVINKMARRYASRMPSYEEMVYPEIPGSAPSALPARELKSTVVYVPSEPKYSDGNQEMMNELLKAVAETGKKRK